MSHESKLPVKGLGLEILIDRFLLKEINTFFRADMYYIDQ